VTLQHIAAPGFFEQLSARTSRLVSGLCAAAKDSGVVFSAQSIGGMFGMYFREHPPQSYAEVMQCDVAAFNQFFHAMLDDGIYFAPSAFEAGFVSAAHGEAEIDATVAAARGYFEKTSSKQA
jgi:glutamate-1-semialdehyde 2,1-aminomutase